MQRNRLRRNSLRFHLSLLFMRGDQISLYPFCSRFVFFLRTLARTYPSVHTHAHLSPAMAPKLSKAAKGKKAMSSVVDITTAAAAATASRRTISANWGRSLLTQDTLKGYEESGPIFASIT